MKVIGLWRALGLSLMIGGSVVLASCTKVNQGVGGALGFDTDLKLTIRADNNINPDEKGVPSPVFVRFYQLASPATIERADFIDLYEKDATVLGDDFISKRELERLTPGEVRKQSFVLNPETRYVALYAEFFRYEDARFVTVFPVTQNNVVRNEVFIDITSNQILKGAKTRR